MKKIILILALVLISSISFVKITNAVPAAPSPFCGIVADVLNVKKIGNYYNFNLDVIKIFTSKQEGNRFCNDSYIDAIKNYGGVIMYSDSYNKNPILVEGQKIQAQVHFNGDENFAGYFLSNVQIIKDYVDEDVTWGNLVILRKQIVRNYFLPIGTGLIIGILFIIYMKRKK